MSVFVYFFTTLDLIWLKFLPQDYTHFDFFSCFQLNMLGDSININGFNWNPVVLKKIAKTSKGYHFLAQLVQKMGSPWATPKTKKSVFAEITKPDQ